MLSRIFASVLINEEKQIASIPKYYCYTLLESIVLNNILSKLYDANSLYVDRMRIKKENAHILSLLEQVKKVVDDDINDDHIHMPIQQYKHLLNETMKHTRCVPFPKLQTVK
jgi:hypothetical protein